MLRDLAYGFLKCVIGTAEFVVDALKILVGNEAMLIAILHKKPPSPERKR